MKRGILLILVIILISGCWEVSEVMENKDFMPEDICVQLCLEEKAKGTDLSNGPCLSDPGTISEDWVCDIAHKPREDIDNIASNQCQAFREGRARHFVEVDENCEVIKKV